MPRASTIALTIFGLLAGSSTAAQDSISKDWTFTVVSAASSDQIDLRIYYWDGDTMVVAGCGGCDKLLGGSPSATVELPMAVHEGDQEIYVMGTITNGDEVMAVIPLKARQNEASRTRGLTLHPVPVGRYNIGVNEPLTLKDREIIDREEFGFRLRMVELLIDSELVMSAASWARLYGLLLQTSERFHTYSGDDQVSLLRLLDRIAEQSAINDDSDFWEGYFKFLARLGVSQAAQQQVFMAKEYIQISNYAMKVIGQRIISVRPPEEIASTVRESLELIYRQTQTRDLGRWAPKACMSIGRRFLEETYASYIDDDLDPNFSGSDIHPITNIVIRCAQDYYDGRTLRDDMCLMKWDNPGIGIQVFEALKSVYVVTHSYWTSQYEEIGEERIKRRGMESLYFYLVSHDKVDLGEC